MQLSLKEFINKYYLEYQQFYKEPLIKKINNQIRLMTIFEYKTMNVKPIHISYLWNKYDEELEINFSVSDKNDKFLYSVNILINKENDILYLNPTLISGRMKFKITDLIEMYKNQIFNLLLNYRYVNSKKYNSILPVIDSKNDYITFSRMNDWISFNVYREARENVNYIETMDTMAGFLKIGRKFGLMLNTGEYFVNESNCSNKLIFSKNLESLIGNTGDDIFVDKDDLVSDAKIEKVKKKRKKR